MHCIINQLNIHYLYSITIVFYSFATPITFQCGLCFLLCFLLIPLRVQSQQIIILFYFFSYEQFESVGSTLSVLRSNRTELNLASVAILASCSPLECRVGSAGSTRERGSHFPFARFQLEVLNMDRSTGRRVQLELCAQLSQTC